MDAELLEGFRSLRQRLANPGEIQPSQAKLYSHHVLRDSGASGLPSFTQEEFVSAVDNAVALLHSAIAERDVDPSDNEWQAGAKRAGELFEWASSASEAADFPAPLKLMAATAYWLAGYPAMARGALRHAVVDPPSQLLASLLREDIEDSIATIIRYWSPRVGQDVSARLIPDSFVGCIGLFIEQLMWGDSNRASAGARLLREYADYFARSRVPFAGLIAESVAISVEAHTTNSLRKAIHPLMRNGALREAFERYLRLMLRDRRTIAWPSQRLGIARLRQPGSFLLTTPTGSGKTTIAEIALIEALLSDDGTASGSAEAPIAVYLVPSRALASQVEAKLSDTLRVAGNRKVRVTGLYGGSDWGPTDVWLTSNDPVVLVCTFEKMEALVRHLGPWLMPRLRLIVVDEFHQVVQPEEKDWRERRNLRLESLMTRLFARLGIAEPEPTGRVRVVALSAVARDADKLLARWIAGSATNAEPVSSPYRSTRQLFGSLTCRLDGSFRIEYELLDRVNVYFGKTRKPEHPFVPKPVPDFPAHLEPRGAGAQIRVESRALWAAVHLAGRAEGHQPSVLVFVPQQIEHFATRSANLLETTWATLGVPSCVARNLTGDQRKLLDAALVICEEYYGRESSEYRLLSRGIVIYHGRMPTLLQRRLKRVVEQGVCLVVAATSTLSEGVNLPVEYVLLTSVMRSNKAIPTREIENLLGRAGRPGVSTEGRVLVVLDAEGRKALLARYNRLVSSLAAKSIEDERQRVASPLAEVIGRLWKAWSGLHGEDAAGFLAWLEEVDPTSVPPAMNVEDALDALDSIVLSASEELPPVSGDTAPDDPLATEEAMRRLWSASCAKLTPTDAIGEELPPSVLASRARFIRTHYPQASERRRIYRSGLPPVSGRKLLSVADEALARLREGHDYATWDPQARVAYLSDLLRILKQVPLFNFDEKVSRGTGAATWTDALLWWLAPEAALRTPKGPEITAWYALIAEAFGYRGAWALGGVLAIAFEQAGITDALVLSPETWGRTELPWIAFWAKELLIWGTHDPIEAFTLARGVAASRAEARKWSAEYFAATERSDAALNPIKIREWVAAKTEFAADEGAQSLDIDPSRRVAVRLSKPAEQYRERRIHVLPVPTEGKTVWIDFAGFTLGDSDLLTLSGKNLEREYVFDVDRSLVSWKAYLP